MVQSSTIVYIAMFSVIALMKKYVIKIIYRQFLFNCTRSVTCFELMLILHTVCQKKATRQALVPRSFEFECFNSQESSICVDAEQISINLQYMVANLKVYLPSPASRLFVVLFKLSQLQ